MTLVNENIYKITKHLRKHFIESYATYNKEKVLFHCALTVDKLLVFPFYVKDVEEHNPYDVVNAIWEYISEDFLRRSRVQSV